MRVCIACGKRPAQPNDDACLVCMWDDVCRAERDNKPKRLALSVTLTLTPQQFTYLQDAVKRDLENLEEMAPWDVGEYKDEHKQEMRLCKAMIVMLAKVEQEQMLPF